MERALKKETQLILSSGLIVGVGQTVFFILSEEYWNKPYPKKRSDVYDVRSVILRGVITDIKDPEFKANLTDNNGFEKDGEKFVFHKNTLLANQYFDEFERLGKWEMS